MSPEVELLLRKIDRLEKQLVQTKQQVEQQQITIAQINLRWENTFHEDTPIWLKKEELVKLLLAEGLLQDSEARGRQKRDYVRYFVDKVRRDKPFTSHVGGSKPPRGTAVWEQSQRVHLFHRTHAVEQFRQRYKPKD